MPRNFRPGLHISKADSRPQYGSQDVWIGTAKAYIKFPDEPSSRLILHEFLAARMANALGVPVPFGEAASMPDGSSAWATAHIGSNGQEYAPPSITDVLASDGEQLAGIAVFDTWIFNPDRTDENLIWHEAVGLWAIDHEQSFCGDVTECVQVLRGLKNSAPVLRIFDSQGPAVESLVPWVRKVQSHGKEIADRCTKEAYQRGLLTSRQDQSAYRTFLSHRAGSIAVLVEKTLQLPENALVLARPTRQDRVNKQQDLFERHAQTLAEAADSIGGSKNET